MSAADFTVEFFEDPHSFWAVAQDFLECDPVVNTVVTSQVNRLVNGMIDWPDQVPYPRWFAVVRSGGEIIGVAMRSANFAPYPAYVLPMADGTGRALGAAIAERGELHERVNGATPTVHLVAEAVAHGRRVEIAEGMRLHEVRTLVVPDPPSDATLRRGAVADVEKIDGLLWEFGPEADAQAGRSTGHEDPTQYGAGDLVKLRRELADGLWWVVETGDGNLAHITKGGPPALGVARIGPVYTSAAHRGRGYASAAVAASSAQWLAEGVRVCLFTDIANPVSNKVYADLGYEPVTDMVNLILT